MALKMMAPRLGWPGAGRKASRLPGLGFYHSPEWRGLVKRLIRMRGGWCETCGAARGATGANGRPVVLVGDHIVEIKDGGARLDPDNVQLLCRPCHMRKTAKAKAARVAGDAGAAGAGGAGAGAGGDVAR